VNGRVDNAGVIITFGDAGIICPQVVNVVDFGFD